MCYSVYKNVCASFLWLEMRLESNGVWKRIPCTRYHSFCFLHIATWVSFIPFSTLLPCRLLPHHSILFITITTQQNLPLDHDGGECEQMLVVVIIMKWQKDAPGTLQLFGVQKSSLYLFHYVHYFILWDKSVRNQGLFSIRMPPTYCVLESGTPQHII